MVWEETIILLPDNVRYVFLSATIPNAKQFAEWVCHLHKQVSWDHRLDTSGAMYQVLGVLSRAPFFGQVTRTIALGLVET